MFWALLVVSGLALFLLGVITGGVLVILLERNEEQARAEDLPPVCDDP